MRIVTLCALFAALTFAAPAFAQSTTTCVGDQIVTCHTLTPPPLQQFAPQPFVMPDAPAPERRYRADGASPAENMVAFFRGDPKRKAGKLLAKGDCAGALKVAVASGDLAFARDVRDYCQGR